MLPPIIVNVNPAKLNAGCVVYHLMMIDMQILVQIWCLYTAMSSPTAYLPLKHMISALKQLVMDFVQTLYTLYQFCLKVPNVQDCTYMGRPKDDFWREDFHGQNHFVLTHEYCNTKVRCDNNLWKVLVWSALLVLGASLISWSPNEDNDSNDALWSFTAIRCSC